MDRHYFTVIFSSFIILTSLFANIGHFVSSQNIGFDLSDEDEDRDEDEEDEFDEDKDEGEDYEEYEDEEHEYDDDDD